MLKTCSRCGQAKDSTEYYASGTGKYGLFSFCKECYKAAKRETYARLHKKPDGIRYDRNGRKLHAREYVMIHAISGETCFFMDTFIKDFLKHMNEVRNQRR